MYRLGLTRTRAQARQLVNHGHILVDGSKVDIPSYRMTPGQKVQLRESSKNLKIVEEALENTYRSFEFVSYDTAKKEGLFVRRPERKEVLQ